MGASTLLNRLKTITKACVKAAPAAAGFATAFVAPAPSGRSIMKSIMNADWNDTVRGFTEKFTGFLLGDKKLHPNVLIRTYTPIIGGVIISDLLDAAID